MASPRDDVSSCMYAAISAALHKPISDLSDGTQLIADLGAKSVNFVRIIADLEDEFDLDIPFTEFRKRATIGEAIDYVAQL